MKSLFVFILFIYQSIASAQFNQFFKTPAHVALTTYNLPAANPYIYNLDLHFIWKSDLVQNQKWGYYMQFYFDFENGSGAYIGPQYDDNDGKKFVFSAWDDVGGQTVQPLTDNCKRFDHEGYGTWCMRKMEWKTNTEYKLRVWNTESTKDYKAWCAWVSNYETSEETFIGCLKFKNAGKFNGHGWIKNTNLKTINEFYLSPKTSNACSEMPAFYVQIKGPYANNGEINPEFAYADFKPGSFATNCENTYIGSLQPFSVEQKVGHGTNQLPINDRIQKVWHQWNLKQYNAVDCLYSWGERMFPEGLPSKSFGFKRLSTIKDGQWQRDYRKNGKGFLIKSDLSKNELSLTDSQGNTQTLFDLETMAKNAGCY